MTENEPMMATTEIDQTVARIEEFYRVVTGRDAPTGETSPIPAEKDPAEYVGRKLNQLLELLGAATESTRPAPAWIPPMTVWESEKEIVIRLDLPGVVRDQVQVTSQHNVLTVSGIRQEPSDSKLRLRSRECPAGPFRRVMLVPAGLRAGEPSAEMKSGVLEIRIARETPEAAAPKAVKVN